MSDAAARRALVFGASGPIGEAVVARLLADGWRVDALSRDARADGGRLRWLRGSFDAMPPLPPSPDAIVSCGPLDRFAHWSADALPDAARVVAFGSTSVHVKHASPDAAERDVAARLREGECVLAEAAARRGAALTVLRPTLVYGAGRDATLTRIAALGARFGGVPLPRGARGLRQPVHVDDLAQAAVACIDAPGTADRAYDVPGGETLAYRDMVARTLAALPRPARLVELPAPLFALALAAARASGRAGGLGDAAVARMREDLVFDASSARRDFGYAPRGFAPTAAMLGFG